VVQFWLLHEATTMVGSLLSIRKHLAVRCAMLSAGSSYSCGPSLLNLCIACALAISSYSVICSPLYEDLDKLPITQCPHMLHTHRAG
jgi:hypothetical protein